MVGASDFTGNPSLEETRFRSWNASPLRRAAKKLGMLSRALEGHAGGNFL